MWYVPPAGKEQELKDVAPQPRTAGAIPVEYKRIAILPPKGEVILPIADYERMVTALEKAPKSQIGTPPSEAIYNINIHIDSSRDQDAMEIAERIKEHLKARISHGV